MVIVLVSLGLLFLGSLGAELSLARLSILGTICGLIVYFAGSKILRAMAFPMAFLLFAIPIPVVVYNEIVFPLQFIASRLPPGRWRSLNLFPIMREGNVLILPAHALGGGGGLQRHPFADVACLPWLPVMDMLLNAALSVRWFLVLAMVPLAIISNGTRVMITAIMAQLHRTARRRKDSCTSFPVG